MKSPLYHRCRNIFGVIASSLLLPFRKPHFFSLIVLGFIYSEFGFAAVVGNLSYSTKFSGSANYVVKTSISADANARDLTVTLTETYKSPSGTITTRILSSSNENYTYMGAGQAVGEYTYTLSIKSRYIIIDQNSPISYEEQTRSPVYSDWIVEAPKTVSFSVTCSGTPPINASFNSTDYNVYRGDFDGDGVKSDYLLQGKQRFVLIFGDISIPIVLKKMPTVKFLRQNDGSYLFQNNNELCASGVVSDYPDTTINSLLASGAITSVPSSKVLTTDFNSDGNSDVAIFDGASVAVFHWNSTSPSVVSSLKIADDRLVVLEDVNGDGKLDIKVFKLDGEFVRVYLASAQGLFFDDPIAAPTTSVTPTTPSTPNPVSAASDVATINETWKQFTTAMVSGDFQKGSKYAAPKTQIYLNELISVSAKDVGEVLGQIKKIAPIYVSDSVATFLVDKMGDDGQHHTHTVSFIRSPDGSWKISEL